MGGGAGGRAGRRFHGPVRGLLPGVVGTVGPWSGRCREGQDAAERGGELVGPGPVGWDVQPAVALASGDPGGGVQQGVPQPFGFGRGEVAVQGEVAQPGEQVDGEGDDLAPGFVDAPGLGREPAQAGGFRGAHAVLDAGVDPVAGLEALQLPAGVLVAVTW